MEDRRYLSVSAINRYLNAKIESDINLKNMLIQGEISNTRISKGHLYFVLKDEESEISAIMFSNNVALLNFTPTDGMKVIVKASLQLYQKRGMYSLLVTNMKEYGLGLLYQEFLKLKEKLSKEGLFDDIYKKEIPKYSENIGLITSPTGDAMHDVVSTISKRFPIAKIYLYPALVQGLDAPQSLIKAIDQMNSDNLCDLCIIARGGGSFEDLSCFNDEGLARKIFDSRIPIISGVGHEADFTICDYVSDFRAPTPTGAAVKATSDKTIILNELNTRRRQLSDNLLKIITNKNNQLNLLKNSHYLAHFDEYLLRFELMLANETDRLINNSPLNKVNNNLEKLSFLKLRLENLNLLNEIDNKKENIIERLNKINISINNLIYKKEVNLNNLIDKMILLNPLNIMGKGYSLVYKDDKLITSKSSLVVNDEIDIKFIDGNINAIVKNIK